MLCQTCGIFMAPSVSSAFSGAALLQETGMARCELPRVMSLSLADFSMHGYDHIEKYFLNRAELHLFPFEMVCLGEIL